ncbi:hypothetical protein BHM03_00060318, partial [Ensete ventricosum]
GAEFRKSPWRIREFPNLGLAFGRREMSAGWIVVSSQDWGSLGKKGVESAYGKRSKA